MKIPVFVKRNPAVTSLARAYYQLRTANLEKVIFTATTGRSGTLTLAKLFSAIPDCLSLHEPYPIMNGDLLRAATFSDMPQVERYFYGVKSIYIRRAAIPYRYYVESNHMFIKSFVEYAAKEFSRKLEVVHLVRDPVEVATSLFRLDECPGTPKGDYWALDYRAPSNRIGIADLLEAEGEFRHPFYRCLWYWFEIEARTQEWRGRLPGVRFHRFETNWFNDQQRVLQLLDQLHMPYDRDAVLQRVGQREHARDHQKRHSGLDPEVAREMCARFERVLVDHGYGYLDCLARATGVSESGSTGSSPARAGAGH